MNIKDFGQAHGQMARLYTLEHGQLRACITDYAGALVSLENSGSQ